MNPKQLKTLWVSIGIIVVMLAFPPWQYRYRFEKVERRLAGPYRFVVLGVAEVPVTSIEEVYEGEEVKYEREYFRELPWFRWTAEVDWVRLVLPILIVAIVSAGLMATFRSRE